MAQTGGMNVRIDHQSAPIYEDPEDGEGARMLVDRVWPRGISKEEANLDHW